MQRLHYLLIAFCLLPLASPPAVAQDHTVRGTVTSERDGVPLPGVNVIVKGTTRGAATSGNGQYSLTAFSANDTLVFSYLGFETLEEPIAGRSVIDVAMAEDVAGLDEVIVVGYGTQRKSTITGSISSVDLQETAPLPTHRTDQMLQGRASGVLVKNTNSAPGGETVVRVRGMNSILGSNDALIVIDGMQGGSLSSLNPQDIQSIEILKGPSATAIYGSEGANGVVLITTKQGRPGGLVVGVNSELGSQQLARRMDLMNAAQYARNVNAQELANNVDRTPVPIFTDDEIRAFEQGAGTDWQDELYQTALTQNHQISLRGGTEDVNYYASGSYFDQGGILLNSGYDRITLRANLSARVTDWARFNLNWAGFKEKDYSPPHGGGMDWPNNPVGGALRFPPTLPTKNEDGTYSVIPIEYGPSVLWNPLASAVEPNISNNGLKNDITASMDFTLLNGLTLQVVGAGSFDRTNNFQFWNLNTFNGKQNNGQGRTYDARSNYYQYQNILTYDRDWDRHQVTLTGVTELKYSEYFDTRIDNKSFINQSTGVYDLGGSEIQSTGSSYTERMIQSALGRMSYVFLNRYLVNASYRIDGSSVFGEDRKWGHFPAASVGWRLSEEPFLNSASWLTNMMLRASWGRTGNQAISPYQTLARISQTGNYPWFGSGLTRGFRITRAANPLLQWESTTQTNFGLDLALFGGWLSMSAEYYDKVTDKLLMQREVPLTTGLSSIISNVGSMGNTGFELSIEAARKVGAFNIDSGLNFTRFETKVLDLGEVEELAFGVGASGSGTSEPFMYLREGEKFGQMIGWGYEGTWNTDEAAEAARYGQLPGDPHYTDVNDDGAIDLDDQMVIGNALPDFIVGMTNRIGYRQFELQFLIEGTVGNDIFNVARINRVGAGTSAELLDRWTPENQDTDVPGIIDGQTRLDAGLVGTINFPAGAGNQTGRWVEDGSYLRLKNVTFAYRLPQRMANRLNARTLRLYAGVTNVLTLTDYSGFDPEVSSFTGNDAQLGVDYNSYPPATTFNFGVDLTF